MVHKVLLELGCRGRRVIRVTQEHRVIQEGLKVLPALRGKMAQAIQVLKVMLVLMERMAPTGPRVL